MNRGSSNIALDLGSLARTTTQVEQLCAADLALADNGDLLNEGAVDGEDTLNADTVGNAANGKGLCNAAVLLSNDGALEDLDTLTGAFLDLDVYLDGIAHIDLGLFSLQLRLPDACSIAVEPEPQEPPVLPNLSHFQYRSYHPKPGGGFSEIHDLREYRPGDSLHEIHWKLSAKTDKLIVREAEEPDLGLVVLSFDFSGTRTQLDSTLRQLLWLSGWLTEREVAHQIDWIEPDSLEPQTKSVKTPDNLRELLNTLLQTHLTGNTPSLASRAYPHADWRYHVQPEEQEVQQA